MNPTDDSTGVRLFQPLPTIGSSLKAALWPAEPIDIKVTGPVATFANQLHPVPRTLLRSVIANLEMVGLLIDGLTPWRRIVLLSVAVGILADYYGRAFISPETATWLAVGLFVLRQGFLLGSFVPNGVATWFRIRFGEESGGRAYEGITALFFYHRSYSYSLMLQKTTFVDAAWLLPYTPYLQIAGSLLIGIGFVVNTWAFLTIGRPAYYYLDMYYGQFLQPFSNNGLYRLLKNPMYSVGQLPAYGLALYYGSWIGLAYSVANHLFCYLFYYQAEWPHIQAVVNRKSLPSPSRPVASPA